MFTEKKYAAFSRFEDSKQDLQQSGLASPVWTHDSKELPFSNLKIHIPKHRMPVIGKTHIPYFDRQVLHNLLRVPGCDPETLLPFTFHLPS